MGFFRELYIWIVSPVLVVILHEFSKKYALHSFLFGCFVLWTVWVPFCRILHHLGWNNRMPKILIGILCATLVAEWFLGNNWLEAFIILVVPLILLILTATKTDLSTKS